jgi:predicted aminopeptidase
MKKTYTVKTTCNKIAGNTVTETFTSKRAARAYAAMKRRIGSHVLANTAA